MKKIYAVMLLAVAGLFGWWLNSSSSQSNSAAAPAASQSEKEQESSVQVRAIKIAQPLAPTSGVTRYDPVTVAPCNIVPSQEQTISSQVDGILESVWVDLGHKVEKGELLAKIDDRQARAQAELLRIRANSEAAQRVAQAQQDEAESKIAYALKANENGLIAVPELEYKTYVFQKERFAQEGNKAREEQKIAQKELTKIAVLLDEHLIKSGIAGDIVKVLKRPGETVKQAEPLFQVANIQRLRIEGLCQIQQADLLRAGMKALVEPDLRGEQLTELTGHTAAITSLAISADGRLLASASEDRSVILWGGPQGNRRCLLPHPSEVGAVAFCPLKKDGNAGALLTGSGDGQVRLWTLSSKEIVEPAVVFSECHEGAIRAVAFSTDGNLCATGGEDKHIGIWEAATGKHLYWLEAEAGGYSAHKGAVTSLSFAADGHLISYGRDNCIKVWKINERGGAFVDQISGRTGEVRQFSVGLVGTQVIFDHGEELRLLDRISWNTLGSFRSQRQGRFTAMANLSPSGRLVLTTSNNGRVQLWKVPAFTDSNRLENLNSYEIRHFVSPNAALVTCGVFAPDEKVIFTGGSDKVIRVWPVPPAATWSQPLEARITYIGSQVERGTDTVRLRAEMDNPTDPGRRLRPGTFATLKIYPEISKDRR